MRYHAVIASFPRQVAALNPGAPCIQYHSAHADLHAAGAALLVALKRHTGTIGCVLDDVFPGYLGARSAYDAVRRAPHNPVQRDATRLRLNIIHAAFSE